MQYVHVLIVEDELIVSEEIKHICEEAGYMVSGQARNADEALDIMDNQSVNVVLMDINLKGSIDGLELAELISKQYNCAIIFCTASADEGHVNRAKQIRNYGYIVKPWNPKGMKVAVDMAFDKHSQSDKVPEANSYIVSDYIFLKESSRFRRIHVKSILYAKAVGSYTDIFTEKGRSTLAINLKTVEASLKDKRFQRIHRSYLVNVEHIDEYEGNQVFIKGESLPISASYKEVFLRRFRFI